MELASAGHGIRDVAQQLFLTPGTVQAVLESTSGDGFKFSPQVRRRILGR